MGEGARYGLGFVSGRQVGRVVPLLGQPVLGRDPGCQVALPAEETDVSARHAQFLVAPDGRVRVVDLHSKGGTWREGERLPSDKPVELEAGTALRFGLQGPLCLFEELPRLEAGRADLVLVREDGPGSWPLGGPLLIGRREGCQVLLDPQRDLVASGHHAHLMPAFGRAILTDLGSANGTWIERRRVTQCSLAPRTRFQLGRDGECPRFHVELRAPGEGQTGRTSTGRFSTGRFSAGQLSAGRTPTGRFVPAERQGLPPLPPALRLDIEAGEARARVLLLLRTEVGFGREGDLPLRCFPRELESPKDALERGDSIAAAHGALALGARGFELVVGEAAPTKLDGEPLSARERVVLPDSFELTLGHDALGLRGRQFRHPRLPEAEPALGLEGRHPVECLALERKCDGADHLYLVLVRQAVLGSSDDAAVRIGVTGVAPHHARLYVSQGSLWVAQLGPEPVAAAGVVLGAGNATRLEPGAEVYLGTARCRLRAASAEDFLPEG